MTSKRQKLARLETRADRFERLVNAALRRAIRAGTKGLGRVASGTPYMLRNGQGAFIINAVAAAADPDPAEPYVSLDDLAAIETAWQQELRDEITPQLMRTLVEGAQDAIEDLAREVPVLVTGRSAIAETYLMEADNRLKGIGSDLWLKTRAQLVVGMGEGESIDKLAARVRQELASTTVRAQRIARTEVIGASNAGAYMQITAMGEDAPETKVWLATGDRRTRPTHRAANGQKRPLTDDFDVGAASMKFPGDPRGPASETVNCRCTLIWDFEPLIKSVAPQYEGSYEGDAQAFRQQAWDHRREVEDNDWQIEDDAARHALQAQRASVNYYTNGGGYREINGALRTNGGSVDDLRRIREIDEAFDSFGVTTSEGMILYRGTGNRDLLGAPGSEFMDLAYVSTTSDLATAQRFLDRAEGGPGHLLQIRIPPGTRMLAGMDYEEELLLTRGSAFRVVASDDTKTVLELMS